jgi:hypothetical protein
VFRIDGNKGTFYLLPEDDGVKEYKKTATILAVQVNEPFEVDTMEGVHEGKAGDWLAQGPAGELWIIDQDIFAATYAPV